MTKEQLRTDYIGKGWEVQPVADWTLVSTIEGKNKYDVNVVSPDDQFGTVQAVVVDDGGAGESASPLGAWKERTDTFLTDLRTFLDTKETGAVYAISIAEDFQSASDEVSEVNVYSTTTGGVEKSRYVVKRRNDTFDFKKIV